MSTDHNHPSGFILPPDRCPGCDAIHAKARIMLDRLNVPKVTP